MPAPAILSELYEVRNFRTGASRLYSAVGQALIAHKAFTSKRERDAGCWYVSRVSDGAFWENGAFGKRVYTSTGDAIRLERAHKRGVDIPLEVATC